jgi:hypothetical protein
MEKESGIEIVNTDSGDIIVSSKAAYLSGIKAAVTFPDDYFYEDKLIQPHPVPFKEGDIKYEPCGHDNLYPQKVVSLIEKNPVASSCLEYKIDLMYGSGFKFGHYINGELIEYTEEELLSDKNLKRVYDFFIENNLNAEFEESCSDIAWFNQSDIELILNNEKTEIAIITTREKVFSRWSHANDDGKVEYHIYSSEWDRGINEKNCIITRALDFKKPGLELLQNMGLRPNKNGVREKTSDNKYIYPIRMVTPSRNYYPKPYWHSIIKSGWIDFANAIPSFKKAIMRNSLNVKYHIEISRDYFPRIFAEEGISKREDMIKRQNEEYANIQDCLLGQEKAGKPIISYFKAAPDGKFEVHDIKINKIDNQVGGEYNEDSREASAMIYTAFKVHPNLIGVIPSKNSSNLSGSDKRELLRIDQTFQTRRRKFLEMLRFVKEINKWPEQLIIYVSDLILTTLDQGKEVQQIINK